LRSRNLRRNAVAPAGRPAKLVGMNAVGEPVLTRGETARRVKTAVIEIGAAFGHEESFAEAGRRLGLGRWAFYFGARAGVLGVVDADVARPFAGSSHPASCARPGSRRWPPPHPMLWSAKKSGFASRGPAAISPAYPGPPSGPNS
jgi:hypothetical protein